MAALEGGGNCGMVVCEKLSVGRLVVSTDFWAKCFSRVLLFPILMLSKVGRRHLVAESGR